jgi:hypothetical protein
MTSALDLSGLIKAVASLDNSFNVYDQRIREKVSPNE